MDGFKLRSPQHVNELPQDVAMLHVALGIDLSRHDNLHLIEPHILVYTLGNVVVFFNTLTLARTFVQGIDSRGVGCVGIHPMNNKFAVGGIGYQPRIAVYSYPEMKVEKLQSGGAERGYVSVSFNASGDRLVSLSTAPDFLLTVWDWENERILLHSKAFGQDVFMAKFSVEDGGRLTTCGTGHIRFWRMATTFTGQKLQGLIGKFGKVELSDIAAFVELPDGKVLSGTESGAMLLWEGNFIKCRLVLSSDKPCHEGVINYITLDKGEDCIISAGDDGYVRVWDFKQIDSSEAHSDHSMDVEVKPLAEFSIGAGFGIKAFVDTGLMNNGERTFFMFDSKGRILRHIMKYQVSDTNLAAVIGDPSNDSSRLPEVLSSFHAGAITGMDTCPLGHAAATCGVDGVINYWDYAGRQLVDSISFPDQATCLKWTPSFIDPSGRTFVVGFASGIVRRIVLDKIANSVQKLSLVKGYKPHNAAVCDVGFHREQYMFTTGRDGIIFVFRCEKGSVKSLESWLPLCFITVAPQAPLIICERLSVHIEKLRLLCSCSDGLVREIDFEAVRKQGDKSSEELQSYEVFFPINEYVIKIPQTVVVPPPSAEGEEQKTTDYPPETLSCKVRRATYSPNNPQIDMIVATDSPVSQVFGCALSSSLPGDEMKLGHYSIDAKVGDKLPSVSSMLYSLSNKLLLIGTSDGSFTVRPVDYPATFLHLLGHSSISNGIGYVTMSYDDKYILSTGFDGTLVVYKLDSTTLHESSLLLTAELESRHEESFIKPFHTRMDAPYFLDVVSTDRENENGFESAKAFEFNVDSNENQRQPVPLIVDIAQDAYSIQDAKLKSELDAKRKVAEEKKVRVRNAVSELRSEYDYICKQNAKIPAEVRLSGKELEVDTEYFGFLNALRERGIQEAHLECAYGLEKSEALLRKLRSRLMDCMQVEEMPLKSLDPKRKHVVYSLRVRGVDNRVQKLLDEVEAQVKVDQLEEAKTLAAKAAQKKAAKALDEMQKRANKKDAAIQNDLKDVKPGLTSAAIRRELRKQRKASLEKHLSIRPNKDEDDPQDIEAIHSAEQTLGDYKLKCADEYEVPENQRINAQQKKQQLALIVESMVTMRLRFNQRFLSMRQLKLQMIYNICKDNARIREINEELNEKDLSLTLWEPTHDPMEYPDDRYEVTSEELEEYATTRKSQPWRTAPAPINQRITGAKTFIQSDVLTGRWSVKESTPPSASNILNDDSDTAGSENSFFTAKNTLVLSSFMGKGSTCFLDLKYMSNLEATIPCLRLAKNSLEKIASTQFEEPSLVMMRDDRRRALSHERRMLEEKTARDIAAFDDALEDLRLDRHTIVSNLKLAELKLLVLYQEYELLLTFEGRDIALQQKQLNCQREKADNISSINENQGKLNVKMEDLKQWLEKIQRIFDEFKQNIPDTHPSSEILSKIFRKRIKRVKTLDGDDEEGDYLIFNFRMLIQIFQSTKPMKMMTMTKKTK